MGSPDADGLQMKRLVSQVGCVVVSVGYGLAPESPFPAGVEDCYAALRWTHAQARELGVDRERVAIGGTSAGGGLAAATVRAAG
jgi:acetyl esterase/lipase